MKSQPNPYLLALFTAFLAGIFSLTGGYFIAKYQSQQNIHIKEKEFRVQAYRIFLDKIDRERSPFISQLLNLGTLADKVASDGEIQSFEDKIEEVTINLDRHKAYWQLNSDFNILRLYGDKKTEIYCADILSLISFRDNEVNWDNYTQNIQTYYKKWRQVLEEGVAYGIEEKVSRDEILMIVMTSKLFQELINHLRMTIIRV